MPLHFLPFILRMQKFFLVRVLDTHAHPFDAISHTPCLIPHTSPIIKISILTRYILHSAVH